MPSLWPTAYNGAIELESLEYTIVMEDERDTEVLGPVVVVRRQCASARSVYGNRRAHLHRPQTPVVFLWRLVHADKTPAPLWWLPASGGLLAGA
jgi:hypothetical protein